MIGKNPESRYFQSMAPVPPTSYSISRDGQVIGSYSAQQLNHYLEQRILLRTDFYWVDGMANWKPLAELLPETNPSHRAQPARNSPTPLPRIKVVADTIPDRYTSSEVTPTQKFFLAAHPQAWRRFWARMIDVGFARIALEICALLFIATSGLGPPYKSQPFLAYIGTFVGWVCFLILYEGLLLSGTSTTIGKWLFRIRISKIDGTPLSFRDAVKRANGAVGSGLFYLIFFPAPTLGAIYLAYGKLLKTNSTEWDAATASVVTCRRVSVLRYSVGIALAISILFGYFVMHELVKKEARSDMIQQIQRSR